jgi:hypothetical protein
LLPGAVEAAVVVVLTPLVLPQVVLVQAVAEPVLMVA